MSYCSEKPFLGAPALTVAVGDEPPAVLPTGNAPISYAWSFALTHFPAFIPSL